MQHKHNCEFINFDAMKQSSAYRQLNAFISYLSKKPELNEIVDYISLNVSPDREICGVTLAVLNENGSIYAAMRTGFKDDLPRVPDLKLDSNYPVARALRTQESQYEDLEKLIASLPDLPRPFRDTPYLSTVSIPVTETVAVIIGFDFKLTELSKFHTYFDCLRSVLSMYLNLQAKKFINEFELTNQLTPRQETILQLINDGFNNREIAQKLSYSVSLIRQETMRIYAKLGVNGRNELKALANKIK